MGFKKRSTEVQETSAIEPGTHSSLRCGSTTVGIIILLILFGNGFCSNVENSRKEMNNVLIVYSSGSPVQDIYDRRNYEVDGVSSPTPRSVSCELVAKKVGAKLRSVRMEVRVAEAKEIERYEEILNADVLVIGSPAHFSNVSWEMKRLFDEQFHKIYMLRKEKLGKKKVAAFATAEIEFSANAALKAIKAVVQDCRGDFGPTLVILLDHSESEIDQKVQAFVRKITG